MDTTNDKKAESGKKIWIPLSSGSFLMLSWTVTLFSGVLGFKIGAKMFPHAPHEFEAGPFTGASVGLIAVVVLAIAVAKYGFWRIYKLGRSNNG